MGKKLGYVTEILPNEMRGDVRKAAQTFADIIRKRAGEKREGKELILFGGEFTVSVTGKGKGEGYRNSFCQCWRN